MPQFTIPKGSFVNLFRNPITGRGGGVDPTNLMAQLQEPGYGYGGGSTKGFYSQGDKALAPDQFGAGKLHPLLYTQGLISGQNTDPYLAGYWQERPTELASTYNILNQGEFGGFDPYGFLPAQQYSTIGGDSGGSTSEGTPDRPDTIVSDDGSTLVDTSISAKPPPVVDTTGDFIDYSPPSDEELARWNSFLSQIASGEQKMEAMRNFAVPPSFTTSRDVLGEALGTTQALTDWDVPEDIAGAYSPGGFGTNLANAWADAQRLTGGSFGGLPTEGIFADLLRNIADVTGEVEDITVPDMKYLSGLADTLEDDITAATRGVGEIDPQALVRALQSATRGAGAVGTGLEEIGGAPGGLMDLLRTSLRGARTAAEERRAELSPDLTRDLMGGVTGAEQAALARQGELGPDLTRLLKRDVGRAEQAAGIARTGLEGIDLSDLVGDITGARTAALGARTGLEGIDLSDLLERITGAETLAGQREAELGPDLTRLLKRDVGRAEQAAGIARTGLEDISIPDVSDLAGLADRLRTGLGAQAPDIADLPGLADLMRTGLGAEVPGMGGLQELADRMKTGLDVDVPDISELEGLLEALRQSFTGATGAVGGVQEGLKGILDPLQAALDEATAGVPGPVVVGGPGGIGEEYEPAIPGEDDVDEGPYANVEDLFGLLQQAVSGLTEADPLNVGALRADPITASLLADLEKSKKEDEAELRSKLQQFGVLRGGGTADLYGELFGEYGRTELDVLSDAAKRADERRMEGLLRGTDLAGLLSERELGIADLMGVFGGAQTMKGRDADLGLLASMVAALDPSLGLEQTEIDALMRLISSGIGGGGFGPDALEFLRTTFRVTDPIRTPQDVEDYARRARRNPRNTKTVPGG